MKKVFVTLLVAGCLMVPALPAEAVPQNPVRHAEVKGDPGQDGEVLTTRIATVRGVRSILMGGNFDHVRTPDGRRHRAKNLAAVSLSDPNRVVFTGNVDGHVRAMTVYRGSWYIGGDFTRVNGVSRRYVAAVDVNSLRVTGWAPRSDRPVYGLAAARHRVVFGGKGNLVRAYSTSGRSLWNQRTATGDVKVVLQHPNGNSFYVGGLFDRYADRRQHGLVRVNARTGRPTRFNPRFRFDSPLTTYDGDCILSLAFDRRRNRLVVGSGGGGSSASRNAVWSLNPRTGSWKGSGWGRSHRKVAGDVQAVAVHGNRVYAGNHRSHRRHFNPQGRFTVVFNLRNGRVIRWDPGLWGNQRNQSGSNNGVSSLTVSSGYLVVGGAFLGYGDRSKDRVGGPGQRRQGLAVFRL